MSKELKNVLASYLRSLLVGVSTLWLSGVTDWKMITFAMIAAVLPPFLRALDPNDPAFGRLPSPAVVDKAVKKAPAKVTKSVAKKKASKSSAKKPVKKATVKRVTKK